MVRSIISIILVSALIAVGAIFESDFINRQFAEFDVAIEEVYVKTEEHTAVKDDIISLQNNWLEKKKYLHAFIPHNEIKEMDLWIAEAITLVENEKWEDAISKLKVLWDLSLQIPKTFRISFENIF